MSYAIPIRKREKAKRPNVVDMEVITLATAPITFDKIRAGMRP